MFNSLETSLYCIYDKKLKTYQNVFSADGQTAKRIFVEMANDVSSPQYMHTSDYDCISLGLFDNNTSELKYEKKILCGLDTFVDIKRIERQQMISALNFIPQGYYKMPLDMQRDVQERINKAISDYVEYEKDILKDAVTP